MSRPKFSTPQTLFTAFILSRHRPSYKWRSSSGWDDKCHTKPHITLTTAAATIKLRLILIWPPVFQPDGWRCVLVEASFIRRRPVKSRDRRLIQSQVDGQLSAMVREMAEYRIGDHHVPRILVYHMAAHHELPGRQ